MGNARRGFTLIELLVVIAIIAVLAAILFPIFTKAKERGKYAACTGNLKQIGFAMAMYRDDNNQKFPLYLVYPGRSWAYSWAGHLESYVKSAKVFICPHDYTKGLNNQGWQRAANFARSDGQPSTSYCYWASLYFQGTLEGWPSTTPPPGKDDKDWVGWMMGRAGVQSKFMVATCLWHIVPGSRQMDDYQNYDLSTVPTLRADGSVRPIKWWRDGGWPRLENEPYNTPYSP